MCAIELFQLSLMYWPPLDENVAAMRADDPTKAQRKKWTRRYRPNIPQKK